MRFIMITSVAASVALAMGAVVASDKHPARLCSANTASNPVCCATIVLGLLGLDCTTPPGPAPPKDIPDFKEKCAASGQQAMCCLLGVAGQGALCSPPI